MAKTVFENEETESKKEVMRVKQIVRTIAQFSTGSQQAVQEVDAYVSKWINDGWKLLSTHYMGNDSQGGWYILYVLVKD